MKFGIVFKEDNEKAKKLSEKISDFLRLKKHEAARQDNLKGSDYILAIGGDGTLIHKACEFAHLQIPFVGLNVGRLGFLTTAEGKDWKEAIEKLLEGKVFLSERISISANVNGMDYLAVNEIVIKGVYRVIDLDIEIDGENFMRIAGDGVIIATQTGSTAYSLSSGGPIVEPELNCFLVTPINPIGLPIPSVIVAPDDQIKVSLDEGEDVSFIVDGQEHTKLSIGQKILIKKGQFKIKFAYFDKHHFIRALNVKFGLSGRFGT